MSGTPRRGGVPARVGDVTPCLGPGLGDARRQRRVGGGVRDVGDRSRDVGRWAVRALPRDKERLCVSVSGSRCV